MGHVHIVAKIIIPVTNENEVIEYLLDRGYLLDKFE